MICEGSTLPVQPVQEQHYPSTTSEAFKEPWGA